MLSRYTAVTVSQNDKCDKWLLNARPTALSIQVVLFQTHSVKVDAVIKHSIPAGVCVCRPRVTYSVQDVADFKTIAFLASLCGTRRGPSPCVLQLDEDSCDVHRKMSEIITFFRLQQPSLARNVWPSSTRRLCWPMEHITEQMLRWPLVYWSQCQLNLVYYLVRQGVTLFIFNWTLFYISLHCVDSDWHGDESLAAISNVITFLIKWLSFDVCYEYTKNVIVLLSIESESAHRGEQTEERNRAK